MVFLLILVTTILLYDLVFNVACFLHEQCHFFVYLVASVLYSHVVMAAISEAFPNIARLPHSLYIPSIKFLPNSNFEKNATSMEWGKCSSDKLIQIWVCFTGHCYCCYACVYNSLKQGNCITLSCPIFIQPILLFVLYFNLQSLSSWTGKLCAKLVQSTL